MIKVFNSDDKTYETNGNVVLNPTYANVHKEDNGEYYLDLETSIEEDKIKHIGHEEGTTIETTGTTLTDVDTTKEHKFISLYGDTQQDSTTGKNLFALPTTQTITDVTLTNNGDGTFNLVGTASADRLFYIDVPISDSKIQNGTYTLSRQKSGYTLQIVFRTNSAFISTAIFVSGASLNKTGNITIPSNATIARFVVYVPSGTSVNIVNEKAQLESGSTATSFEPYTNGPAPNPTYPFDIHNVSGDNTIKICGKNLFDKDTIIRGWLNNNGTVGTGGELDRTTLYINVNENSNYTLSGLSNSSSKAVAYDKHQNFISVVLLGGSGEIRTFITPSNCNYIKVSISNWNNNMEVQLEKGSTATEYKSYQEVQSQLISLGVENLLPTLNATKSYKDTTIDVENGIFHDTTNHTGTNEYACTFTFTNNINYGNYGSYTTPNGNIIELEAGTYTYSYKRISGTAPTYNDGSKARTLSVYKYKDTQPYTSIGATRILGDTASITFTLNEKTKISLCYGYYFYQDISSDVYFNLQLEKGSKANSYSEYGKTPIELCKIGTYQDYIYKDNDRWYLHKEIGKVVLDGSETWGNFISEEHRSSITYTNLGITPIAYNSNCLSNYFVYTNTEQNIGFNLGYSALYLRIDNSFTNITQFKSWLSTNKPIFYLPLATPTDTEITDTTLLEQLNNFEKMKLYNGITNISITPNDLTPIIKLHYNYITGGDVVINNNDYIKPNNIIVANTPTGEQAFRITDIDKRKHKIVLKAWHISYDTKNYVIQDSYVVDKTCNQAMDHLNNATDNTSPFTTTSDITTINSYRCVRRSLFEAFNVVLERWGGHFVRDNWNFKIMNSIGQDNGVVVRYAKNLKDIEVDYNWDEVCTKILPVGDDGLMLDEIYLYADIQYDIPYSKVIHFAQNVDTTPYEDEDGNLDEDAYTQALKNDLRSQANNYLQEHQLPQVNYTLQANLEKITDVGDIIQVIDERLGVNITTSLISFDYDPILERYTYLEFGNFKKQLSNLTEIMATQTNEIVSEATATTRITLENELNEATSKIWGVLGSSYVLVEGDKILILDSLPKETATNVIMLNSAGIGFSNTGINGTFTSAWTIDNVLNMQNINVINLTADLIKGGTLKLGSNLNQNGILEVYDESNNLIAELNKDGLKMFATDGGYILINTTVGFAGYDRNNVKIYWADGDEFHMKKSVVEEEITLVDKMRIIPITITNNGTIVNDGIGFVSTL